MPPRVVILLSDKRSGSTMFQEELCRHPDIRHVAYTPHTYFETHHWLKAAVLLDMPASLFSGARVYGGYGSRKNARRYLVDCVKGNVADFQVPEDDERLIVEGWDALCRHYARPVFFEKSPQLVAHWAALSLLLKWMEQTEFDVRVVGLVRNPMAVFYSAWKLFHTPPEKRQFGWLNICRNMLAFRELVEPERFLTVRYDDILRDPIAQFQTVCEFIGVAPHGDVGSGVRAPDRPKWRDDPEFTLQLDPAVSQMAHAFGYSDAELDNPEKQPVPARRRLAESLRSGRKLSCARFRQRVLKPLALCTWQRK